MRSVIVIAIASLAAGAAFAQYDAKEPSNPPAAKAQPTSPPPAQAQPATPTTPNAAAAMTETQAKQRFESQGYTNVSELKKDQQGLWTAKAMKDGRAVEVSLDPRGQIIQQN